MESWVQGFDAMYAFGWGGMWMMKPDKVALAAWQFVPKDDTSQTCCLFPPGQASSKVGGLIRKDDLFQSILFIFWPVHFRQFSWLVPLREQ